MEDNKSVVVRLNHDLVKKILDFQNFKALCYDAYAEKNNEDPIFSTACEELAKIWRSKSLVEVISDIVENSIPTEVVR